MGETTKNGRAGDASINARFCVDRDHPNGAPYMQIMRRRRRPPRIRFQSVYFPARTSFPATDIRFFRTPSADSPSARHPGKSGSYRPNPTPSPVPCPLVSSSLPWYLASGREVAVRQRADAPQPRRVRDRLGPLRPPPNDAPAALVHADRFPGIPREHAPLFGLS